MAKYRIYDDGLVVHQDEWDSMESDPQRETIHFEECEVCEYDLIGDAWGRAFELDETMEWLAEYGFVVEPATVLGVWELMDREYAQNTKLTLNEVNLN